MVSNPAAVLSYGHSHVLNVVHVLTYSTVHHGSLEKNLRLVIKKIKKLRDRVERARERPKEK